MSYTIVIGTVGGGLWVGYNDGEKWRQIQGPMDPEANVRALACLLYTSDAADE